jgi:hypothetical protein
MSLETAIPAAPADGEMDRRFATARQVADAVLFEGYVLYPYRASSAKNRLRWQFGVLMAPQHAVALGERSHLQTECLMEPGTGDVLLIELRFLRVQRRAVQAGPAGGPFHDVPSLELEDRVLCPWDEGVEERVQVTVPVDEVLAEGRAFAFERPADAQEEAVLDAAGETIGRLLRRRARLTGVVELSTEELPVPYRTLRLRATVRNTTEVGAPAPGAAADDHLSDRDAALADALVSAHLVLGLGDGSFLSPADPPQWAGPAVAQCRNEGVWPVLAGVDGSADVILASPIILEDHPAIAPESPGAMYDLTEIDEILALRTAALTEQEKREARGTDPRAAAVVELADTLPAAVLDRLHGAIRGLREATGAASPEADFPVLREPTDDEPDCAPLPGGQQPWWDPGADRSVDPAVDHVLVDGRPVARGSRVVLRPGRRRTDAQDMFAHGRTALVEAVLHDVDGAVHIAVTLEDDPGADIQRAQGRFLYFQPDEVTVAE